MEGPIIRKYSDGELDKCRFLVLIIATSGLNNPPDNQQIDYYSSCPTCKAGRQFKFPIKVTQNSMGKKKIDQNGRYGFLVFENNLVQKIIQADLKGIEFFPIEMGRDKSNFKLGQITSELPQLIDRSIIYKFKVCETCGRSGHYNNYDKVDEYWYNKSDLDNATNDFYRTWEYFGIWEMGRNFQTIIVSQKTRQFLKQFKLRHLKYEPIFEG
jgi:hypothetical protein